MLKNKNQEQNFLKHLGRQNLAPTAAGCHVKNAAVFLHAINIYHTNETRWWQPLLSGIFVWRLTMKELLTTLHDRFYFPNLPEENEKEIENYYNQLKETLNKSERKLVLRIIDTKDHIADELSLDSFICGFRLAQELARELNYLERLNPLPIGRDLHILMNTAPHEQ